VSAPREELVLPIAPNAGSINATRQPPHSEWDVRASCVRRDLRWCEVDRSVMEDAWIDASAEPFRASLSIWTYGTRHAPHSCRAGAASAMQVVADAEISIDTLEGDVGFEGGASLDSLAKISTTVLRPALAASASGSRLIDVRLAAEVSRYQQVQPSRYLVRQAHGANGTHAGHHARPTAPSVVVTMPLDSDDPAEDSPLAFNFDPAWRLAAHSKATQGPLTHKQIHE
jgi:hypothetical protein